jgi:hypothetical protein
MHPMFVKLFLDTDADDLLTGDEEKQRTMNRARRNRSRMVVRVTAPTQDRRPRL